MGSDTETPGQPLAVGNAEHAATSRAWPAFVLVSTLSREPTFLEVVDRVRDGSLSAGVAAALYVRRDGRPRRVIRHVIESAAESSLTDPAQAVCLVGALGVATGARPEAIRHESTSHGPITREVGEGWTAERAGAVPQWPHSRSLHAAATMVARLGSGSCLQCGSPLASDGQAARRYCGPCTGAGHARHRYRLHQEAVRRLLNAVGDALGVA